MNFLRDLGCDYLQGYLISVPLPAAEFEPLLRGQLHRDGTNAFNSEANRLLAALRHDEIDVGAWLQRLFAERSPELANDLASRDWVSHGLDLKREIESHLDWRQQLTDYVRGRPLAKPITADEAASTSDCVLGQWLLERQAQSGSDPALLRLEQVHRAFHALAGRIVTDYSLGYRETARRTLASVRFRTASRDVVVALVDCCRDSTRMSG